MHLINKRVSLFLLSAVWLVACNTDDEPSVAPPADLIGAWNLTQARTVIDGDSVTRSFIQQYLTEQMISATPQELSELESILREPTTNEFNDSTTVEIQPNGGMFFRDPQRVDQSTWEFREGSQLIIGDTSPIHVIVSSLTTTTMVLLLNPDDYLRFSLLANAIPEDMQLEYTFAKQ